MAEGKNIAVVLFQLGGPDSQAAVEPFLYNLFCDPDIINFPGSFLARKPLAKLISTTRSKTVRLKYAEIGGSSPIRRLTEQQARALATALRPHLPARVGVAMRYWHPDTEEAIAWLESAPFDELVLLPLYPHYSFATTGSSLKEWNRLYTPKVPVQVIDHFFDHPDYIAGIVERTNSVLRQLPRPDDVHLVFSAHGLPMALVEKGDPYPQQIEASVRLVRELGAWPNPHVLCFQSRVGPQKWLQPSLTGTIEKLARERSSPDARDPDFLPHRTHRDAARNQHRGARAGRIARHRRFPHDARAQRLAALDPRACRPGAARRRPPLRRRLPRDLKKEEPCLRN